MQRELMNSQRTITLLGIGHTNAHILRQWSKHPNPDCRLVCITKFDFATYSGMLPGTLAKQFQPGEMEIQLAPFAERTGAELILDEVVGLDPVEQQLHFFNRDSLHFDALSIGVGSMPAGWNEFDSESLVPIKPMQTFIDRLEKGLEQVGDSPRCVIVGEALQASRSHSACTRGCWRIDVINPPPLQSSPAAMRSLTACAAIAGQS